MPVYEFFCQDCNTIYKFFSRTVNTEKIPRCPKCDNPHLQRRMSTFAVSSGRGDTQADEDMPPIDESKMEKAMEVLAREADRINEDDPRQAAQLMRKFSEATGLNMGPGMEEALSRMERGEDPEQVEAELGDVLESEEPFLFEQKRSRAGRKPAPTIDDTLYDM